MHFSFIARKKTSKGKHDGLCVLSVAEPNDARRCNAFNPLGSKEITICVHESLNDAELRKQMKSDFDKRTEGLTYKSPLPDFIKEPVGLPDEMRSYGSVLELKQAILNRTGDHQLVPHSHDHAHPHDHEHDE